MKKDLVYITCDSWWDTDINILPELGDYFNLTVFCSSDVDRTKRKYPEKKLPSNIEFHDCCFFKSRKSIVSFFRSLIYCIKLLLAIKGKVVFWVIDNNFFYVMPLLLLCSRNKTIVSFHNYVQHGDSRFIDRKLHSLEIKVIKYFHLQSPKQEAILKIENPDKKTFSTNMSVKGFGKSTKNTPLFDNNLPIFLFFGYIRAYKRLDLFIEIANKLQGKANFVIAGNCKDWDSYQKVLTNCDVKKEIRFIDNTEIPYFFEQSHFLVLPYDDSTQSGPLLTAYYYNLPIIASDLDYFKEMITDGVDGFIFKKGSIDSLMEKIEMSIEVYNNNYESMKISQYKRVENYKKTTVFSKSLLDFIESNGI